MRKYFTLIVLLLLVLSCSKDDNFNKEVNNSLESRILDFSSLDEVETKIHEIQALKQEKESKIFQKTLFKNNIPEPISNYFSKKSTNLKDIKYDDVKDDLEFYHKERLNSIYELRRELGFTSLQSIVDEINSLKLLNPKKAEELYTNYSNILEKSKFETSSIFGEIVSNILNDEAKVKVGGKLLDLKINNYEFIGVQGEKSNNDNYIGDENDENNIYEDNSSSSYMQNDSGIFIEYINAPFLVEWKVGKMLDNVNFLYQYAYYTKLRGFVKTPEDQYIGYPITINVGSPSYCKWSRTPNSNYIQVGFEKTGTGSHFFNYTSRSRNYYLRELYIQDSTFSIVIEGVIHTLSVNSLSRDYSSYDPDLYF